MTTINEFLKKKYTNKKTALNKYIYNYVSDVDYKVSTGSLKFNFMVGGGLGPGIIRFGGKSESGKSTEASVIAKNFLKQFPNGRVAIIPSEGRHKKLKNYGFDYTEDFLEWSNQRPLVLSTNIYDNAVSFIQDCVDQNGHDTTNPDYINFLFIVDSIDSLVPSGDLDKDPSESFKVAGSQVILAKFLAKYSLPFNKLGHMAILISQVRSNISTGQGKGKEQAAHNRFSGTGGNAGVHHASWMFDFLPRRSGDFITEDDLKKSNDVDSDGKDDKYTAPSAFKNKIVAEIVRIEICKSDNESTRYIIDYPVKRQAFGGGIWKEREVYDLAFSFGIIQSKGAWYSFSKNFQDFFEEKKSDDEIVIKDKQFQGKKAVLALLDNQKFFDILYEYLNSVITSNGNPEDLI